MTTAYHAPTEDSKQALSVPGRSQRTARQYLTLFAKGFVMGSADVVPGVSGGTMAFILGIYQELLEAISAINTRFVRSLLGLRFREAFARFPWSFLLVLGAGIAIAIITFAEVLAWALVQVPSLVWGFFFGLVLASIFVVRRRVGRWSPVIILALVGSAIFMYWLVGRLPAQGPDAPWFLFISGALASCGMILPGISGAFILVLLGEYEYLLNALVNRDLTTLIIVGAGAVIGLLSVARLLRWLFRHHHDITVAALMGLMVGSLRKIWPWKETLSTTLDRHGEVVPLAQANVLPEAFSPLTAATVALILLGFVAVWLVDRLAGGDSGQSDEAHLAV